jgi:hypothetical protein
MEYLGNIVRLKIQTTTFIKQNLFSGIIVYSDIVCYSKFAQIYKTPFLI